MRSQGLLYGPLSYSERVWYHTHFRIGTKVVFDQVEQGCFTIANNSTGTVIDITNNMTKRDVEIKVQWDNPNYIKDAWYSVQNFLIYVPDFDFKKEEEKKEEPNNSKTCQCKKPTLKKVWIEKEYVDVCTTCKKEFNQEKNYEI